MGLKEFYYSLEDKYYAFMDSLQEKGIKVYDSFITPLEDGGIPSFPVFVVGLLLVMGVASLGAYAATGGQLGFGGLPPFGGAPVDVMVKVSADGVPLDGITVRLTGGDSPILRSTSNGIAEFRKLPRGRQYSITISDEGYEQFRSSLDLGSDKESVVFEAKLSKVKPPAQEVFLSVSNEDSFPVSNAKVSYFDDSGAEVVLRTDAQGQTKFSLSPAQTVSLEVSRPGFETQTVSCSGSSPSCEVVLSSTAAKPSPDPSVQPSKASVRVEVVDQSGEAVKGKVTLYNSFSSESMGVSNTDSQGVVLFKDVPYGTEVYVSFKPEQPKFEPLTSDPKTASESTEFFIQLSAKTVTQGAVDFNKVTVQALNSKREPVEGAQVRLYFAQPPLRAISSLDTDAEGKAAFEVANGARVYATVYAAGFLPDRTRVMTGGEGLSVVLKPAIVGNYGPASVFVQDDALQPVGAATVSFITIDGFASGVPSKETESDGTVLFDQLPLMNLHAIATFGPQTGKSDVFPVDLEGKTVTITLQPAKAFVSVNVVDAVNKTGVPATVTAFMFSDSKVIGSCQTSRNSCTIQVPADRRIGIRATAPGYGAIASEEITVKPENTYSRTLYLLPSSLLNQLVILNAAVVDSSGRNVTAFDKGAAYTFQVSANLPSSSVSGGLYLRVGQQADVSQEPAVFNDYSKPSGAEIMKGSLFNPGPSCSDDLGEQNGPAKWVDYAFRQFGAQSVSSEVFIKPTATAKDEITLHYRIYSKAGDVYLRKPDDSRYAGQERTADLDSCYAGTYTLKLPVISGKSTCNDNACLSTLFRNDNASAPNGLRVEANTRFRADVSVRAFNALESPYLKVQASPSVQIVGYDFGVLSTASGQSVTIPLSFFKEANGTVEFKALLPTQSAKVTFTFGDSSGTILEVQRFVVVQGNGVFQLAAQPDTLEAQQPSPLAITVLSDKGIPISDAKISLREKTGHPFSGFASSTPDSIQGDGTEGKGLKGVYKFANLKPDAPGVFEAVAEREGFAEGAVPITVTAAEPLLFGQESPIELDCEAPTTLTVSTDLKAELQVLASFVGTACAKMRVIGGSASGSAASFRVKPGKETKIILEPVSDGECAIAFNTETLNKQALGEQDVFLSVKCGVSVTPTPTAGVTPTPDANATPTTGVFPIGGMCPRPFFNDILMKHLATYGANNEPQAITAMTAPTVLVMDTQGIYALKVGDNCKTADGAVACEKPIYPLIPTNAMAFSITNRLGVSTNIQIAKSSQKCFAIEEVGRQSSFFGILSDSYSEIRAISGLMRNQYRTYVIKFKPKPECVQYEIADGVPKLKLTPDSENGASFKFQSVSMMGSSAVTLNFKVNPAATHASDKYALMFMPSYGGIAFRGKEGATFEEPAYFANNIHASKEYVTLVRDKFPLTATGAALDKPILLKPGQGLPATLVITRGMDAVNLQAQFGSGSVYPMRDVKDSKNEDAKGVRVTRNAAPAGLDLFDVVGNVPAAEEDCSGTDYCTKEQADAMIKTVKGDLDSFVTEYSASLDRLSFDNSLMNNQNAQQFVYQQAAQEYAQLMQVYAMCIQQVCSGQGGYAGQYPGGYQAGYPASGSGTYAGIQTPGLAGQYANYNNPGSTAAGTTGTALPPECAALNGQNPYGYNPGQYSGQYPGGYGQGGYPGQQPYAGASGTYAGIQTPGLAGQYGNYNYPGQPGQYGYNVGVQSLWNDGGLQAQLARNPGFASQFYQQPYVGSMMGQYGFSQGDLRNPLYAGTGSGLEPVLKVKPFQVIVPAKVAGEEGGIRIYKLSADLTVASSAGSEDWVTVDSISSNPYRYHQPLVVRFSSDGSSEKVPADTDTKISGFPYLRLKDKASKTPYYELVNWIGGTKPPASTGTTGTTPSTTGTQPTGSDTPTTSDNPAGGTPSDTGIPSEPAPAGTGARIEVIPGTFDYGTRQAYFEIKFKVYGKDGAAVSGIDGLKGIFGTVGWVVKAQDGAVLTRGSGVKVDGMISQKILANTQGEFIIKAERFAGDSLSDGQVLAAEVEGWFVTPAATRVGGSALYTVKKAAASTGGITEQQFNAIGLEVLSSGFTFNSAATKEVVTFKATLPAPFASYAIEDVFDAVAVSVLPLDSLKDPAVAAVTLCKPGVQLVCHAGLALSGVWLTKANAVWETKLDTRQLPQGSTNAVNNVPISVTVEGGKFAFTGDPVSFVSNKVSAVQNGQVNVQVCGFKIFSGTPVSKCSARKIHVVSGALS